MSSSVGQARGALVATAAAFLMGLSPAPQVSGESHLAASTLAETVATVDPARAPGDEVVAALGQIDHVVTGLSDEAAVAVEAEAEAAAELQEATSVVTDLEAALDGDAAPVPGASGDRAGAAAPRGVLDGLSGRALAPTTGRTALTARQGFGGRSATESAVEADLAAARRAEDEAAARAESAAEEADEAARALAEAQATGVEFVATVEDRVTAKLREADGAEKKDAKAAASLRAEEEIAGSLEELAADRQQWEAAVVAAPTGTTAEAESAGAEPDDAEKAAAEEKAAADKAAADRAAAEDKAAADKAVADKVAAEKAAADKAAAERTAALNAPLPDPKGAVSGALAGVLCADNTRIVVDASLGGAVQSLIDDARAAGVGICAKSAFRSYNDQVALRRQNCGASDYAVYQAPPSTCSPPTARPGTSNHEGGLAVDFSCDDGQPMTHASPCFAWLDAHAGNYGLYNLPSEPWHWSVTGR